MKILVVEDDIVDARIVQSTLCESDISTTKEINHAVNLADACKFLEDNSYDVILSDLGLPNQTPTDVLSILQELAPQTPLIVLTGDSRRQVGIASLQFGADDFMNKNDISSSSIRRSILNSIERRKLKNQLSASTQKAKKATKAKTLFLANMSHEIRTPLNLIIGSADLLKDTTLNADQKKYVETFQKAGEHLLSLISDILDISKIESGELVLKNKLFDLEDLSNGVADLAALTCRSKKLDFEYYFDPKLRGPVKGDPDRLKQVLFNLMNNGIKFTESGSIKLFVTKENGNTIFRVEDTGPGIPIEKREHIFSSFYQVQSKGGFTAAGTGLGLTIVRELIENMGGHVFLDTSYREGARFQVELPLEFTETSKTKLNTTIDYLKDKTTLLMSANTSETNTIREVLKSSGGTVTCLQSGADTIRVLEKNVSVDHLFLDIQMPDIGALGVLEKLGSHAQNGNMTFLLPVVHRAIDTELIKKYPNANYIYKPVTASKLESLFSQEETSLDTEPLPKKSENLKILIAEDDIDNQELIRAYFSGSPHTITFANNGLECLKTFKEDDFDLILMDIQMPDLDGYETTKKIRSIEYEQSGTSYTPIVALSANAFDEDVEKAKLCGFSGYLSKPIKKKRLLGILNHFPKRGSQKTLSVGTWLRL